MLVTLISIPIFFIFGIAFGSVSWLLAAWIVCGDKDWTLKWQSFVRSAAKMSSDHNTLVVHGAEFVETLECIKPCRESGKTMLIQYYKIGHSLSIYLVLFSLTVIKGLLLVPIWSAVCCQSAHQQQREQLLATKSTDKGTNEMLKVTDTSSLKDTADAAATYGQGAYDETHSQHTVSETADEPQTKGNHVDSTYNASGAAYDTSWIAESNKVE